MGQTSFDVVRKRLAKFHTPLVKGIDAPHVGGDKYTVLIQGEQGTQSRGAEAVNHQKCTWSPTGKDPLGSDPLRAHRWVRALHMFTEGFLKGLSAQQCPGLAKCVGKKFPMGLGVGVVRVLHQNKLHRRDLAALMQPLKKRVLGVGSRLTPDEGRGTCRRWTTVKAC